jgi:hypothetical protein
LAKRGRKPDLKRREQARELRRQGLTIVQIAARLGISKQAAHHLLGKSAGLRPIMCRECGSLVFEDKRGVDNIRLRPVCLQCAEHAVAAIVQDVLLAVQLREDRPFGVINIESLADNGVGHGNSGLLLYEKKEAGCIQSLNHQRAPRVAEGYAMTYFFVVWSSILAAAASFLIVLTTFSTSSFLSKPLLEPPRLVPVSSTTR